MSEIDKDMSKATAKAGQNPEGDAEPSTGKEPGPRNPLNKRAP